MKPAKSSKRHWKQAASEHLPALSEVATAWSPRLRGLDGPAATLRTANSLGSRSANSRPTTPTAYAKYIGRVGALAVALGVSGAVATTPGVAWADESSSPTSSSPPASESESARVHFGIGRVINIHVFRVTLVVDHANFDDFFRTLH